MIPEEQKTKVDVGQLTLHTRWLGEKVDYQQLFDLQKSLLSASQNYLLFAEHSHVYTLGINENRENIIDIDELKHQIVQSNRGGDITYHGPGQLMCYPIIDVPFERKSGMISTTQYVTFLEEVIIETLDHFDIDAMRFEDKRGIWVDVENNPRKIAAIGVKISKGRTMHGFALNVNTDLKMFEKIIPCGLNYQATSIQNESSLDTKINMENVVETIIEIFEKKLATYYSQINVDSSNNVWKIQEATASEFTINNDKAAVGQVSQAQTIENPERKEVSVQLASRMDKAGVTTGLTISEKKPDWLRAKFSTNKTFLDLKKKTKSQNLTTVCEEAGCPNISECWSEGTATFMLLGERCTRACGFCLVDTQKPETLDYSEPQKVAQAIAEMGINFAVLTMVARDDVVDGGAQIVAQTIEEIHKIEPSVGVEVLISDLAGDPNDLKTVCNAKPEILNHNLETVPRLQKMVRPSASYVTSMSVLVRAKEYGMKIKSGLIVGMGENTQELQSTLCDLAAIGTDIVTIGQYLRPTSKHLPVTRWYSPQELTELKKFGEEQGIVHVEATPLTRSSHHAGEIAKKIL